MMELSIGMLVALVVVFVVSILFIFACSIINVVHELPNCQPSTLAAIESIILQLGCLINFKQNIDMLTNKIDLLDIRIQELRRGRSDPDVAAQVSWLLSIQGKAVQLIDEVRRVTDNHWYRMWTSSCYQLSYRVAAKVLYITKVLEPQESWGSLEPNNSDGLPVTVVVVLIAYSLTNAIFRFRKSSTTATSDAIDWIVLDMHYIFELERHFKMLRNSISLLQSMILKEKNEGKETPKRKVELLVEGERLSSEAEDMVKHWYKGWTGSRYILTKRVAALVSNINDEWLAPKAEIGLGIFARNTISHIDAVRNVLPAAITNLRHYLRFKENVEKLRLGIPILQRLIGNYDKYSYNQEEKPKELVALEAAKLEAVQLLKEAEAIDQYKNKRFRASRYRLSKRLVKLLARINTLINPPKDLNRRVYLKNQ